MEFTVDVATLRPEVNLLNGIAEKKAGVAALATLLIEASDEGVRLTGTDLDTTLTTHVEASVKTGGSVCIPAQKLCDIVRSLDKGKLTIKQEANNWVRITCNTSKFRVHGLSTEHFPEIEKIEGDSIELDAKTFTSMVSKTAFAISPETTRYVLAGANLEVGDGKVRLVTTDGHRLAVSEHDIESDHEFAVLIPKRALSEAVRMTEGSIKIVNGKNHISFESADRVMTSRKLNGSFPDYRAAIPKNNSLTLTMKSDELSRALKRVAISADDLNHSVKMSISEKKLTLSSSTDGESEETLEIQAAGVPDGGATVHLNWKYMCDFLGVTEKVTLRLGDATSPVEVKEKDSTYIQVPLREA